MFSYITLKQMIALKQTWKRRGLIIITDRFNGLPDSNGRATQTDREHSKENIPSGKIGLRKEPQVFNLLRRFLRAPRLA